MVIQWLMKDGVYAPNLVSLIDDCESLIMQKRIVHLLHAYRKTNEVADGLAKKVASR